MQKPYTKCETNLQTIIKQMQKMQQTYETNDTNIKNWQKQYVVQTIAKNTYKKYIYRKTYKQY